MLRYICILGFPPADVAVRDVLMRFDREDKNMQGKSYSGVCHFLLGLFVCAKGTVTALRADDKKDRIVKFREFMLKEQKFGRVGENRRNFYASIVNRAKKVRRLIFILLIFL
jgi:hypothetical protein